MELEPRVCEARDLDFNHDLMQNPQRITTSSYLLSPCIRFPQKKKKKVLRLKSLSMYVMSPLCSPPVLLH